MTDDCFLLAAKPGRVCVCLSKDGHLYRWDTGGFNELFTLLEEQAWFTEEEQNDLCEQITNAYLKGVFHGHTDSGRRL
jgi:hypothetical protein